MDWITDELKLELSEPGFGVYTPTNVPRVYSVGAGVKYADAMSAKVDEMIADGKVALLLNAKVTELVTDNKVVTGVKAGDKTYSAKSVILATGGFMAGNRLGGNAITEILVSGRTAANSVTGK